MHRAPHSATPTQGDSATQPAAIHPAAALITLVEALARAEARRIFRAASDDTASGAPPAPCVHADA